MIDDPTRIAIRWAQAFAENPENDGTERAMLDAIARHVAALEAEIARLRQMPGDRL